MKRKKILESAVMIFSRKGFHQATMDEIAEHAGVAKGTLYYNFSSKAQLFSATVTDGLETITKGITDQLESDLPFIEHFHRLIEVTVTLYLKHHEHMRIMSNELSSGIDDEALAAIETIRERLLTFFSDLIRTGQEKGYLRQLDPRLTSLGLTGMIDSLCMDHLNRAGGSDPESIITTIHTILSSGLLDT